MTTASQAVARIREALEKGPTPGPWQVVVDEHPHHYGGKHVERRIFTTWDHPQLKGPDGVVNGSVGVGAEKGGKPHHFVSIDPRNADYIAACSPDALRAILDDIAAKDREIERLRGLLTENDMFTLIGHAHTCDGDMHRYFLELAERIARVRGDEDGAQRCSAIAAAPGGEGATTSATSSDQ